MFLAKVADAALSTTKTILIQRSRWIIAGIVVMVSDMIYFWITKSIVTADNYKMIIIVSVAGGIGCSLACYFGERFSKNRTYVNVIMSDDYEAMKSFMISSSESVISSLRLQLIFPNNLPR